MPNIRGTKSYNADKNVKAYTYILLDESPFI